MSSEWQAGRPAPADLRSGVCALVACGRGWCAPAGPPLRGPHYPGRGWPWGCAPGWLRLGECGPRRWARRCRGTRRPSRETAARERPSAPSAAAGTCGKTAAAPGPEDLRPPTPTPRPRSLRAQALSPPGCCVPGGAGTRACGVVCTSPVYISSTNISLSAHLCKHGIHARRDQGALVGRGGPTGPAPRLILRPAGPDPLLPGSHTRLHRVGPFPRQTQGTMVAPAPGEATVLPRVGVGVGAAGGPRARAGLVPPHRLSRHKDPQGGGRHHATRSRGGQAPPGCVCRGGVARPPLQGRALAQSPPVVGVRPRGEGGAGPGVDRTGEEANPGGGPEVGAESGQPADALCPLPSGELTPLVPSAAHTPSQGQATSSPFGGKGGEAWRGQRQGGRPEAEAAGVQGLSGAALPPGAAAGRRGSICYLEGGGSWRPQGGLSEQ